MSRLTERLRVLDQRVLGDPDTTSGDFTSGSWLYAYEGRATLRFILGAVLVVIIVTTVPMAFGASWGWAGRILVPAALVVYAVPAQQLYLEKHRRGGRPPAT